MCVCVCVCVSEKEGGRVGESMCMLLYGRACKICCKCKKCHYKSKLFFSPCSVHRGPVTDPV